MSSLDKTLCRTPTAGKDGGTNIPTWKFDLLRRHILDICAEFGSSGVAFKDLNGLVKPRLTKEELTNLGSIGWHVTTVKLELEVRGEIKRLQGVTPQSLVPV